MAQGVRLSFTVDGGDRVSVALSRFATRLTDLRRFWVEYAAPKLYQDIAGNLASQGAAVGGWVPLSPAYAAWKAKHYPSAPMLQRDGRLAGSLTWDGSRPGPEGVFEAGRLSLVMGTRVPYVQYHQRGGTKPGRPPQRRIIFLPAGSSQAYGRLLHAFAIEEADSAGLHAAMARAGSTGGGML